MASLVVLERLLWLNLTEIKESDRTALLDSPISLLDLFGSTVDGFAERYIAAQQSLQAMSRQLLHCLQSLQDGPVNSATTQANLSTSPAPAESGA